MNGQGMAGAVLGATLVLGLGAAVSTPAQAHDRLGSSIEQELRAEGPFFTPEERAIIERACGYAPGSWDGFQANMSDGLFRCSNGRVVDTAEVRAVMAAAGPRIGARVERVMSSPEIQSAIQEVARTAEAQALRAVDQERIALLAARQAQVAVARAMAQAERQISQAESEARRARRWR